jgi:hypothetical protein
MQRPGSNSLVWLCVLESLWPAHSFSNLSGTLERAGHQSKPRREQSQHHNDVEQTRVLKVDLKIGENAYKDDHGSAAGENPSGYRAAIEEQKSQPDHQRKKRQPESVRSPPAPVAAGDLYLVHYQVAACDREREAKDKQAEPARSAAGALKLFRAALLLGFFLGGHGAKGINRRDASQ